MSPSPEKSSLPTSIAMPSELAAFHVSIGPSLKFSTEIKQEEPDLEPQGPVVAQAPIPPATPAIVSSTPAPPTFTSITNSTTSTPISVVTPTVRKQGRQGRPQKERTLTKNPISETINFPCHEGSGLSETHFQKLLELDIYPADGISSYTRSIPFKGAKEGFLRKTGRSRFDVFEYRFTAPNSKGEKKHWWVMWDYYNGLVRVHDFFDCCKPGKTEPGNAVKEKVNPGLQSICHNITGGNLHAQGYWIPFDAAKALAAKFCHRIRFALTPIFGDDFPTLCLPESHPEFGKYQICPTIIQTCQKISAQQHEAEKQRVTATDSSPPKSAMDARVSLTPDRTAANRYFDPVRGGYTNGSSSRSVSTISPPTVPRHNIPKDKTIGKKISKAHKAPRGISISIEAGAQNLLDALNATTEKTGAGSHLPRIGYFAPPAPKALPQSLSSDIRNSGNHSFSPPVSVRVQKKSENKRQSHKRTASSSPEPHPIEDTFADADQEVHEEQPRKKLKTRTSEPSVYTNSFKNQVTFNVGTFTQPGRSSRDPSIPEVANPYTRARYNDCVASQIEETPEDLQATDAANQLMELQRRDYDRDFAQRNRETSSSLKRRRSS